MNRGPVFKRIFALLFVLSLAISSADIRAHAQSTQNGTIGYQGELNNSDLPAEGLYDFEFTLWDAAGTPIGQPEIKTGVEVLNGRFSVDLDFGTSVVAGAAYRLEVAVRNAATSNGFVPIPTNSPHWVYAPMADSPLQAAAVDAVAYGQAATAPANALYVAANGFTGVGITTPLAKLHVTGNLILNSGGNPAIFLGTGTVELNRYLSIINSPQKGTAGGLKTGGLLVADSYAYANPAKNNLIVKGNVGIGTADPAPSKLYLRTDAYGKTNNIFSFATNADTGKGSHFGIDTVNRMMYWRLSDANDYGWQFQTTYGQAAPMTILNNGNVGIGTVNPGSRLMVRTGVSGSNNNILSFATDADTGKGSHFGIDTVNRMMYWRLSDANDYGWQFQTTYGQAAPMTILNNGNVGIGTATPGAKFDVVGTTRTDVLKIDGGADIAEPFIIAEDEELRPGMVVAIDPANPGQLRLADSAYDRTVAGVVSGAGDINPGLILQKEGSIAAGEHPVALTGRVYVYADATNGAITPGDLLTTANKPGHAMKVTDHEKAQGAILGKAMSKLEEGTGLVLVLVTLQ